MPLDVFELCVRDLKVRGLNILAILFKWDFYLSTLYCTFLWRHSRKCVIPVQRRMIIGRGTCILSSYGKIDADN